MYKHLFNRLVHFARSLIVENSPKNKQILIYGRPSVSRNAFTLIIQCLKIWKTQFSSSAQWTVLSAGEAHKEIPLGGGIIVRSVGKLSLENYAKLLNESAIGLSLMVSPHPSYPPLEMAHYGMRVITNNFESKDLPQCHENIVSLAVCSPESIAECLAMLCREFEIQPTVGWMSNSYLSQYLTEQAEFPFIEKISSILTNSREPEG